MANRNIAEIALLLDVARSLLLRVDWNSKVDDAVRDSMASAAWRIADAGLLMREECERARVAEHGIGSFAITQPTGRGALLPTKVEGK